MPNLVFDTPTPPSQLYSSSAAIAGGAYPVTSLRPRASQPVVTSTVLPKSRLREQYRPEMDYDLDTSCSSDSTFSSTDLAAGIHHNNNNYGPPNKQPPGRAGEVDENQAPNAYYRSPGFGDVGMGPEMNDKQRFMDVRQSNRQQQQRGKYLSTRVDENSDATLGSSSQSSASDSEGDIGARARQQQQSTYPNKPLVAAGNLTSTPYPGPGISNNNISKSAFDGMARELRKEFDRIMHAGHVQGQQDNNDLSRAPTSHPSPPQFRSRRTSNVHRDTLIASPPNVQQPPTALPRGVMPRRPSSAGTSRALERDHERTPTTQRTFGQEIKYPRQGFSPAPPLQGRQPKLSPPKTAVTQLNPSLQRYQPTSPFHAAETSTGPGIVPPNNTRTSDPSLYKAAESPSRQSVASSNYPALRVPDVTGLTEGLTSPSRVGSGPASHRNFAGASGSPVSAGIRFGSSREALSGLKRRLEALESENARSEAKVAELQDRLASQGLTTQQQSALSEQIDANAFVRRLQTEINNLQHQIQNHNRTLAQLQAQQPSSTSLGNFTPYDPHSWHNVFTSLREALQHLADQVSQVRRVLEEVLETMKMSTPQIMQDADLLRPGCTRPAFTEQPVHAKDSSSVPKEQEAGLGMQGFRHSVTQPANRFSPPLRSSSAPIPQGYTAEFRVPRNASVPQPRAIPSNPPREREPLLERAERILSSLPPRSASHVPATCITCQRQLNPVDRGDVVSNALQASFDDSHIGRRDILVGQDLPMQTVVTRALRDLEEDFAVHKRIYIDLSEEFKRMDPATPDVGRRKLLASHLRESIDILEMKADEIKRLYDLLHYRSEMQTAAEYEKMRSLARAMGARSA